MQQIDFERRSKKTRKYVELLPNSFLGFQKAEIQEDDLPKRKAYKKPMSQYQKLQRKFNFRGKFKFVISANSLNPQQCEIFTGMNPQDWSIIFQLILTTNHHITCPICLNQNYEINAAVITACGHIYCWSCILMHFKRSKKHYCCPVCNQLIGKDELKYCKLNIKASTKINSELKLVLRAKQYGKTIIYDTVNFTEDKNFSRIIRVNHQYMISQMENYKMILERYLKQYESQGTIQQSPFINQAIESNYTKLLKFLNNLPNETKIHDQKNIILNDNIYYQKLYSISKSELIYFYQQQNGLLMFLHPICHLYLEKEHLSNDDLPKFINAKVLYKQEIILDEKLLKRYKYLNHIPENNEISFLEIQMQKYLPFDNLYDDYIEEIQRHKNKIIKKEQFKNFKYEQAISKRIAKKKQQQLLIYQPWPIDTQIKDLKTCNRQLNFPSLGNNIPQAEFLPPVQQNSIKNQQIKISENITKINTQKQPQIQEFPALGEQQKNNKKNDKQSSKKRKKNKKQVIDITGSLFQVKQQQA